MISGDSGTNGSTATMSFVDQTYSQIRVPEATTLTLVLVEPAFARRRIDAVGSKS